MAKRNVGKKGFFTITVLSSTLLVMFMLTGFIQSPTRTTSDASGASGVNLNNCNIGDRIGGVKLYNGDKFTGGNRVLCMKNPNHTNKNTIIDNLNKVDVKNPNKYNDIWGNFQNKTESIKIRAHGGCLVRVKLYSEYNARSHALIGTYENNRLYKTTNTKSIELPRSKDNKTKSIKLFSKCPVRT